MLKHMLAAMLMVGLMGVSLSAAEIDTKNAACPVAKGKGVNPKQSAEHNGGKVFFCCGNCKNAFGKDPSKFEAKANHQLAATKQATQTACPLTGRSVDGSKTVTVGKVDVSVCCGGCLKKAQGMDEAGQVNALFSSAAFKKGYEVKN